MGYTNLLQVLTSNRTPSDRAYATATRIMAAIAYRFGIQLTAAWQLRSLTLLEKLRGIEDEEHKNVSFTRTCTQRFRL